MSNKKSLDTDVNLLPFISLLAVLICSLLLTVTWIQIGSMSVKQALDGSPSEEKSVEPTLWAKFEGRTKVSISVDNSKKLPRNLRKFTHDLEFSEAGVLDMNGLTKVIAQIKKAEPDLRTALIHPSAANLYEDIIDLMDQFKASGINELGVSPL